MTRSLNQARALMLIISAAMLIACGSTGTMRADSPRTAAAVPEHRDLDNPVRIDPRLDALWARRSSSAEIDQSDYPIGPGDVLSISVPEMAEITNRKVRVSTAGTIELPLIGTVTAAGLTEDGLASALNEKLGRFMFNPQVSVFVDEYHNRQVAVVGAVNRPGLVLIENPSETILDVLTQAGGVASTAADEIVLIPAEHHPAAASKAMDRAADPLAAAQSANALSIPLHSTSMTGSGRYLSMPVRPGDVIVVPGGGQVMVVGWVQHPGHFDVGSGLTVLGAIGEAGGPMYAANTSDITLIRSEKDGSKSTTQLDMQKITHGQAPDLAVKANDVVDVPYSDWRIGPYIFYSVVARIGIMGPAIPY